MIWFKVNHAAFQMEAGLIYCGLRIHPHIQHVHQHLHYGGAEALTSGASQGNNFSRCLLGRFGPGPVSAACDGGGHHGSTQAGGRICQYPVSAVGRLSGFSDNWAVGGQIFCCQETTHILYYLRLQVGEAAGGERFGAFLAKGLQGLRQPTDMDLLSTTEKITPGSESITGGCMASENPFQDVMEILLLLYQRDTCIRRPYGRSDHFRKR